MNVVGIDPSLTSTGVAHADGQFTIKWPGKGVDRLDDVYRRVISGAIWPDEAPDLVVIEGYAHGRGHQAHQMGELGGVIRLAMRHAGVTFLDVAPPSLKKYATGKGNAGKELVLVEAVKRLGYDGSSTDEADAMWLRQIGLALYDMPCAEVPATHRVALKVLGD